MNEEFTNEIKSTLTVRQEKCPTCGGRLDWSESQLADDGLRYVECPRCHNKYSDGSGKWTPEIQSILTHATSKYRQGEFEDAIEDLEVAIETAPNCYEAYWYSLLAKNGIIYEKDNGFKPTCNRANFDSFYEQSDYKKAMKYAPEHMKKFYKEQADVVEAIRKEIIELVEKEEPYDIFLSFKKTEIGSGDRTQDSMYANNIYNDLSKRYKVFYSEKSLKAGTNFEPTIFRALQSAKVFILVCSKAEYANAVWVKNEWSRYLRMMKDGLKKPETITIVHPDEFPSGMPVKLARIQGIKYNDRNYDKRMEDFIVRSFAKYPSANNIVRKTFSNVKNFGPKKVMDASLQIQRKEFVGKKVDVKEDAIINQVKIWLEQSNFSAATQFCKGVLQKNEYSSAAKLYLIYADEGICNDAQYVDEYKERINCIKWLDEILQSCSDKVIFQKIIQLAKDICDKAVAEENTDFIVESFNLVAQWAPEEDVDDIRNTLLDFSKSVLKKPNSDDALATSIFDCVLRTYNDSEVEKYAEMNYEFARCLHDVRRFGDALAYYDKSLELIDDAQCYFDKLMCANGLVKHTEHLRATKVEESDLENILKYAESKSRKGNGVSLRAKLQTDLVNFSLIQGREGSYDVATTVFDYIIQFVPQDDKERNKKYLVPFADMLLSMGQYDLAKNYYGPMINVDDLCHEAHWGMIKADRRCRDEKALMYHKDDISEDDHFMKALYGAISNGDINANKYYNSFNEMKLMLFESVSEKRGWEYLARGEYEEAMKTFVELLNFEINTRKRKISNHPECYWGMLLADAQCNSDLALFGKREQYPMSKIQENDYCVRYLKAYQQQKSMENHFFSQGYFGYRKNARTGELIENKPPITKEEYAENILPCNVNHLKILETLAIAWERKTFIERRQGEASAKNKQLNSEKETMRKSASSRASGAVAKKNLAITALAFVILGVVAAVIYGCFVFFSYDISGDWLDTLKSHSDIVCGVLIGIPAILGAIIGFFGGEGLGGAIAGALAGAAIGGVITGIVFLCCWILVPLIGLLVIGGVGVGIFFLKRSMDDHVHGIKGGTESRIQSIEADFANKRRAFENETNTAIRDYNNKIRTLAKTNGIDLYKIGIDEATAYSIINNSTSLSGGTLGKGNGTIGRFEKCPTCGAALDWSKSWIGGNGQRYMGCPKCHNKFSVSDDSFSSQYSYAASDNIAPTYNVNNVYANSQETGYRKVVLQSVGSNKAEVIRIVKDATGLGLGDATKLVDMADRVAVTIKDKMTAANGNALIKALAEAGATAALK